MPAPYARSSDQFGRFRVTLDGTSRAQGRFVTAENAAVAWQRGAWYLRAAIIGAAPNRLISKNYQTQ